MNHQKIFMINDVNESGLQSTVQNSTGTRFSSESYSSTNRIFQNVTFNQDGSCFCCIKATKDGTCRLQVFDTFPLKLKLDKHLGNSSSMKTLLRAQVYHRSNLILMLCDPRENSHQESLSKTVLSPKYTFNVWDDAAGVVVYEAHDILNFFVSNKKNQFLLLTADLKVKNFKIRSDRIKEFGMPEIICMNEHLDFKKQLLALPSAKKVGQVQLFKVPLDNNDSHTTMEMGVFKAHKTSILNLKTSNNANYIATCSIKGTLLRIFLISYSKSTISANLLCEFKRGLEPATVYEMQWSPDDSRIACISNKNTLHIFQLPDANIQGLSNLEESQMIPEPKKLGEQKTQSDGRRKSVGETQEKKKTVKETLRTSICSIRPKVTVIGDRCKINWHDRDTLYVVWIQAGVWEKYIIQKTDKGYSITKSDWKFLF